MTSHGAEVQVAAPEAPTTSGLWTAVDLVLSILPPAPHVPPASDVLAAAAELDVDPLDYCARRFGLSDAVVLERAACWAGLGFSPTVPRIAPGGAELRRVDALASVRVLRAVGAGGERFYLAPQFDELVMLRRRVAEQPWLANEICIVPRAAIRTELATSCAGLLLDESRQRLARHWRRATADLDLTMGVRAALIGGLLTTAAATIAAPFVLRELLLPLTCLLFGGPAAIRLWAASHQPAGLPPMRLLSDAELPPYSVLIPLCNEAEMVPQLGRAMAALDYPPEKIEVLFIVEERSPETVVAVQRLLHDARFGLLVVPDALPHTKPKALNFALPLIHGTHIVVYDAEDIPHPNQLRLAASAFAADPQLDCLQAELAVENGSENWLTALYAGEYAGLFGLLLPLLGELELPMPLGGTSNHFRTADLLALGGWDAFNVTEDADLGVRLARRRRRCRTLHNETAEEAPLSIRAWMAQRTRWMKGWMQTFVVHNRRAGQLLADTGWYRFLFFELFVGGMITASLLHTIFLATVLARLALGAGFTLRDPWDLLCLAILVVGYGGSLALALVGLVRRRQWGLLGYQLLLPFYWVLHSAAAVRAAYELLTRPYYWGKTEHGRTRLPRRIGGDDH
jgi:cellulose synthase/poly-beta-1,6-N-acetylglucosamine synthase-like glycosyltransferase